MKSGLALLLLTAITTAGCGDKDGSRPDAQETFFDIGIRPPPPGLVDADFPPPPKFDAGPPDSGVIDRDFGSPPDSDSFDVSTPDAGPTDPLVLTSAAFNDGAMIPIQNSCHGADLQPQLAWTGGPTETQSYAVVLIDDSIDFVHWIALDLPPTTRALAEGASDNHQLPAGAHEVPAFCVEYCGPCPPNTHTYTFRLYALSTAVTNFQWPANITARDLDSAFGAARIAEARLSGTFSP